MLLSRLLTDGGFGLSILPLAALLTGTFLTIGIAVLLIVVSAIRKRRDPVARNICDDKDKHLGRLSHFSIFFCCWKIKYFSSHSQEWI